MIALDSNILVYAQERSDDLRHRQAISLFDRTAISGAIIPTQVLGEFLNVCMRKLGMAPIDAIDQVADYLAIYDCPATMSDDLFGAVQRSCAYNLQFSDALILTVASRAGATLLLSEDMHDGLKVEGLRIVNPFRPENHAIIAEYLD